MQSKLPGIESTIDNVAKSSKEVRLQQSLRTASDNLFKAQLWPTSVLKQTGDIPLLSVREVAGHDDTIDQLLQSIPEAAVKQGIYF